MMNTDQPRPEHRTNYVNFAYKQEMKLFKLNHIELESLHCVDDLSCFLLSLKDILILASTRISRALAKWPDSPASTLP